MLVMMIMKVGDDDDDDESWWWWMLVMMIMKVGDDDESWWWWKLVMMMVIWWWKFLWWNLSRDESYLVMKVMIVKEVMTGDVSPVAMFTLSLSNIFESLKGLFLAPKTVKYLCWKEHICCYECVLNHLHEKSKHSESSRQSSSRQNCF